MIGLFSIVAFTLGLGVTIGRTLERRSRERVQLRAGPNRRIHLPDTAPGPTR